MAKLVYVTLFLLSTFHNQRSDILPTARFQTIAEYLCYERRIFVLIFISRQVQLKCALLSCIYPRHTNIPNVNVVSSHIYMTVLCESLGDKIQVLTSGLYLNCLSHFSRKFKVKGVLHWKMILDKRKMNTKVAFALKRKTPPFSIKFCASIFLQHPKEL